MNDKQPLVDKTQYIISNNFGKTNTKQTDK